MIINPSGTLYPRPDLLLPAIKFNLRRARFIAQAILRPFMVDKRMDVFGVLNGKDFLQRARTNRAPGSGYNRIVMRPGQDTYNCTDQGLEVALPEEHKKDFQHLNPELNSVFMGTMVQLREHEIKVAALVHNTTTLPLSGTTGLSVTNEWDDAANATPLGDVNYGANEIWKKTGITKDMLTLQISKKCFDDLAVCNDVRNRLQVQTAPFPGTLTTQQLAFYFGVRRVIVGDAQYDTANEGQALSASPIWNPEYALLFAERMSDAGIDDVHLGTTFCYDATGTIREYFPGGADMGDYPSIPYGINQYQDDEVKSTIYQMDNYNHAKLINTDAAFLFGNVATI